MRLLAHGLSGCVVYLITVSASLGQQKAPFIRIKPSANGEVTTVASGDAVARTIGTGVMPSGPDAKTAVEWKREAETHLRAGEKSQAAEAYEQVLRLDPSSRVQLAPVLVRLYAGLKTSDKALGWAKVVMARSPDPQAYLAGVYLSLEQVEQAESILVVELAKSNAPPRTVSLSYQLADLQLHQGSTNSALRTLERVAVSVKGTPDEAMISKRVRDIKMRLNSKALQHKD